MSVRKEYLEKHPYSVWQGDRGFWFTYLPDGKGRVRKKRKEKEDLEDMIVDYWRKQADNPTLEDIFNEWNDRKAEMHKIELSTRDRNRTIFKRHYADFGKKQIKFLEEEEVAEFLEMQIQLHNLTAKSFSNLKTITRGFLKRAKKRGYISWNVEAMLAELDVSDREFKKVIKEDKEEVFNEEEMSVLTTYLKEHQDVKNLALLLIRITGMRAGEVAALKKEDLGEDYIFVRRTEMRYQDDEGHFRYVVRDFPKTAAGVRTVVIPKEYAWLLDRIREVSPDGEWAFMMDGKRMPEKYIQNRLYHLCRKLGIYKKSPHKLRKTYVSILLDNHVDTRMILDQVGHASISVSENNYHRNRKTVEKKQEILSSIGELVS